MVEELVEEATTYAPEPIVYAVPGSPLIVERTVELLRDDPRVEITVVPALSFLDLAWERLGVDPLAEGVRLVDAERFVDHTGGVGGPFLVAQCWNTTLLSDIKLSVSPSDDDDLPSVVLLHHLGLDDEQVVSAEWWEMDRTITPDHLTSLYIRALPNPRNEVARLEQLMRTLRGQCPGGPLPDPCDVDAPPPRGAPTRSSMRSRSWPSGRQRGPRLRPSRRRVGRPVISDRLPRSAGREEGRFTLDDIARGIHDKLVHRHPHIFAEVDAATADGVMENWEEIKRREKGRAKV